MNNTHALTKLLASSLLAILVASPVLAETKWLDNIVAIVDDDIVLASELQTKTEQVQANIARSGQEGPAEEDLRKEVLDLLIIESIQLQMARRVGVRIDDEQLNAAVSRVAAQNNMTLTQFQQALAQSGTSYVAVRAQIRQEMTLKRVQAGNVNQRIQITDQEIRNYLESEQGRQQTSPEYQLGHLLISVASDATDAQRQRAKKKADTLAAKIRNGADYQSLAGQGVTASDLGLRKETNLPTLFADVAPKMVDGDVSEPLSSASGFHIIQLLKSRGVQELIDQTKARHILLKPSAIRSEDATLQLAKKLRQRALNGESFTALAKEYSEDIGSAQEGGDLSWTTPGQLVPEFQQAMDSTAIGAISPPAKTPYGWHIIQVEERRRKDVTGELRKQIARNVIHERKYQDELAIWLRKIRSEAFVDIKS
ncbi:MAG: peptidylprolyl isomerase [Spongiibacteraceae bacterium]